jgi:predicted O-linked N-acetylglucosamine transferase (SPINDLY family)|tara:strand:+ start:153 stop:1976 length:1824 start_codon:yes stop_codon:yes gene_type:complete
LELSWKTAKNAMSEQDASPSPEQQTLTVQQAIDLAVQHHNAGRMPEAESVYQQILKADPNQPVALHLLGVIAYQAGKHDLAVDLITKALAIKPDYAYAHSNLGNAFKELGRLDDAVASYHKALSIKPDYAGAHSNLGVALRDLGKPDEAVASYHKALAINPDHVGAHRNLGIVLKTLGRLDEAVASYHKALAIKPDYAEAHSDLILTEQYRMGVTLKKLNDVHAEWDKRHGVPLQAEWRDHGNIPDPERRLRIGLVSPDLGRHPVGYFVVSLLEHKSKNEVEFICYSDRNPDELTERLMALSDEWTDARGISDEALFQRIRSDRIDILIDLAGHSARNRLLVFALKPAPIQVTWAGYMGSTGLSAMDYLIADYRHVPEGTERHYTEEVIRLPDGYVSYEPPDYAPEVGPLPFEHNGFITFGCFQNPAKINDDVLGAWAEILKAVPNSRLLLKYRNMDAEGNRNRILDQFGAHGVEESRLTLEGKSPHSELLGRYNDVDIALDTFPYTGGLTTCEAVWMGVPAITKLGETFASRHSLSHLTNVGVPELVADDLPDYVSKAVELANDVPRLTGLRSGLRERMAKSALCDGEKFATDFTSAMRQIWREWC